MTHDDRLDLDRGDRPWTEAEHAEHADTDYEESHRVAHNLYRSPLADLILQRVSALVAELEAVAVKLPELATMTADMEAAEKAIDEDYPLADYCLQLDDCFAQEAEDIIPELDNVIAGLNLIADRIRYARKEV